MFGQAFRCCVVLAVLCVITTNSLSREIGYDYIEGAYFSANDSSFNNYDIDGDGIGISGSLEVMHNLALIAAFNAGNFDAHNNVDIDTKEFALGVTLHATVAVRTDVVANLSAIKARYEVSGGGVQSSDKNDTGINVGIGLRHLVSQSVELDANISHTEIFDDGSSTFGLGARFYLNQGISLGIGYATGDDMDIYTLNARFDM